MNSKLKQWLLSMPILILGFGLFYYLWTLGVNESKRKKDEIAMNLELDTCTVIRSGYRKGSYVVCEFDYLGETYRFEDSPPSGKSLVGLSFIVNFDTTNPETALVDFSKPFFRNNVSTSTCKGVIIKLLDEHQVRYEYYVNDEKYNQFQVCPRGLNLDLQSVYTVVYKTNDPQVSYINL